MHYTDKEIPTADPADILQQYEGLIRKIVKRYSGMLSDTGAIDAEDMIQAARMAVLEAQKTYDPKGGSSFLSYSCKPIKYAILKLFGYDNPKRKRPPAPLLYLDEPIDESEDITRLDTIEDKNCIIPEEKVVQESTKEEVSAEVREAIERMKNEKYKKVIKRIWLDGQDKKSLAEELGISVDNVGQCDRNGRGKLSLDFRLRKLVYPSLRVGLSRYKSTLTSEVERAVLWREQTIDEMFGEGAFIAANQQHTDN